MAPNKNIYDNFRLFLQLVSELEFLLPILSSLFYINLRCKEPNNLGFEELYNEAKQLFPFCLILKEYINFMV